MTSAAFDVLGIGNAIVDVISHADDAFLATHKLAKGGMMLIDEQQAEARYAATTLVGYVVSLHCDGPIPVDVVDVVNVKI